MPTKDAIQRTKPKSKPKAKRKSMGRPMVVIDWGMVDVFLKSGSPGTEVADALGIAPITLYRACKRDHKVTFDAYSQQKKSSGKAMLRAKQFDKAMKGDSTMLIFLGKSMLGQTDKPQDPDSSSNGPKNITFTITEELIGNQHEEQDTRESGD